MATTHTDMTTLTTALRALPHVTGTNYWAKGDYERLYVEVGSQNRFPNASTIYVDLNTGNVVVKLEKGKSGAQSYAWSQEVAATVKQMMED